MATPWLGRYDSFLAGLGKNCIVHISLPKRPNNQFKQVWQSSRLVLKDWLLRAYCPNGYTVFKTLKNLANSLSFVVYVVYSWFI